VDRFPTLLNAAIVSANITGRTTTSHFREMYSVFDRAFPDLPLSEPGSPQVFDTHLNNSYTPHRFASAPFSVRIQWFAAGSKTRKAKANRNRKVGKA